jgi:hypothetical protein
MDYIVSKTKRNLIIFSAVFLILKAITIAFVFHATDPVKPDLVLSGTERFLQIVAYGYIMIVLFGYFKHYELKALQMITLSILALEIAGSVIQFSNITGLNLPNRVNLINVIIWSLAMILWIIFLIRISVTDFPALISIRKYAVSIFAVIILSAIIPLLINQIINNRQYFELFVAIIFVIPYVFIIEFAMKLKISE